MSNNPSAHIPKDTTWIRNSFLSIPRQVNDATRMMRSGSGWLKYMDTTLGGNTAINAPYGFCPYADVNEMRLLPDVGKGMGRWYSKHIDDWGHNIHFRMGIPSYSGIVSFIVNSIDGPAARYAATGRVPGVASALGKIVGLVASVVFWEITLITMFIKNVMLSQRSRFYYLKPTMFQYWRSVQTILNQLSANLGLATPEGEETAGKTLTKTIFGGPPIVGIDIHRVASRAQALSFKHHQLLLESFANLGASNQQGAKQAAITALNTALAGGNIGGLNPKVHNETLDKYFNAWTQGAWYSQDVSEATRGKTLSEELTGWAKQAPEKRDTGWKAWFQETADSFTKVFGEGMDDVVQLTRAELEDGSAWVSFRVDNATASVNESFDNNSADTELGGIFGGISAGARKVRHNLADGNTGFAPLDGLVNGVLGQVGDFVSEAAGTFDFINPLIGLFYGANIDLPKRWESSSTKFSTTTVEFELKAGYGNVVSYYQDILVPLACCIAMAAPRGTGMQSHGSPFYVQYYSKGRSQVRIGLVSSLSITRGTGTAGWHKRGYPLSVKVSMTIENMDKIMFAPLAHELGIGSTMSNMFANPMNENAMGDYLATLAALGMNEQEYFFPQLKRNLTNLMLSFDSWLSPARWVAMGRGTMLGELASMFANQTDVRR